MGANEIHIYYKKGANVMQPSFGTSDNFEYVNTGINNYIENIESQIIFHS